MNLLFIFLGDGEYLVNDMDVFEAIGDQSDLAVLVVARSPPQVFLVRDEFFVVLLLLLAVNTPHDNYTSLI